MKAWDYDFGAPRTARGQADASRPQIGWRARWARMLAGAVSSPEAGLNERLIRARRERGGVSPAPWDHGNAVDPDAIPGGGGGAPKSGGRSYELRVLYTPGHLDGPAERRAYGTDVAALAAFVEARGLLADPDAGLGLAILREGCPVYEWTEVAGSDWRDLAVAGHRRRGCRGHATPDVFDRLSRTHDRYDALGYRDGGRCTRTCVSSCPGEHGDLLAAMVRAEAAELPRTAGGPERATGTQRPRGPRWTRPIDRSGLGDRRRPKKS